MLYDELPVAFPWYDKIAKQNRYLEHTQGICDYKLISPADALLPFEFYKPVGGALPTMWQVFEINSDLLVANISANISLLYRTVKEGREYICYHGEQLASMALPVGFFYSKMSFPDGSFYYSEMFFVPGSLFYIANDNNIPFIKLTWYNNSDIRPIFYNNKDLAGVPKFKNVLYLDTFIHVSEPQIVEETEPDGDGQPIPTFQTVTIPHRITLLVPDFLKKALSIIFLHDVIRIVTKGGLREGTMESIKVTSTPEAYGALSTVDILFNSTVAMVKKGCPDNMQ